MPEQVAFEVQSRKKRPGIRSIFSHNKPKWYEATLRYEDVTGVRVIAADAAKFDYTTLGPIAFCLLDVDLYIPIRESLPQIYQQLAPGGVIVVDDCSEGGDWDGAFQAYQEFCAAEGKVVDVRCGKLGIVRKPPAI